MNGDSLKDAFVLVGTVSGALWVLSITFLTYIAQDSRKNAGEYAGVAAAGAIAVGNCFFAAMLGSLMQLVPKPLWGNADFIIYSNVVAMAALGVGAAFGAANAIEAFVPGVSSKIKIRRGVDFMSIAIGEVIFPAFFLAQYHARNITIDDTVGNMLLGCFFAMLISVVLVLSTSSDRIKSETDHLRRELAELRAETARLQAGPTDSR